MFEILLTGLPIFFSHQLLRCNQLRLSCLSLSLKVSLFKICHTHAQTFRAGRVLKYCRASFKTHRASFKTHRATFWRLFKYYSATFKCCRPRSTSQQNTPNFPFSHVLLSSLTLMTTITLISKTFSNSCVPILLICLQLLLTTCTNRNLKYDSYICTHESASYHSCLIHFLHLTFL